MDGIKTWHEGSYVTEGQGLRITTHLDIDMGRMVQLVAPFLQPHSQRDIADADPYLHFHSLQERVQLVQRLTN
jgi:hypothetical protein